MQTNKDLPKVNHSGESASPTQHFNFNLSNSKLNLRSTPETRLHRGEMSPLSPTKEDVKRESKDDTVIEESGKNKYKQFCKYADIVSLVVFTTAWILITVSSIFAMVS